MKQNKGEKSLQHAATTTIHQQQQQRQQLKE
jgi:hypothetical protein